MQGPAPTLAGQPNFPHPAQRLADQAASLHQRPSVGKGAYNPRGEHDLSNDNSKECGRTTGRWSPMPEEDHLRTMETELKPAIPPGQGARLLDHPAFRAALASPPEEQNEVTSAHRRLQAKLSGPAVRGLVLELATEGEATAFLHQRFLRPSG